MSIERELSNTFHVVDGYEPSPDLFARVEMSVEQYRARRSRIARTVIAALALVATVATLVASNLVTGPTGRISSASWVLEVVEASVLLAITAALAPSLRRFGKGFVEDAFSATPRGGADAQRLLDIAYYLIFTGTILAGVDLSDLTRVEALTAGLADTATRLAAFLIRMGALHAATVAILPLAGLVFSSAAWRARFPRSSMSRSPRAVAAERAARRAMIVLGIALIIGAASIVPGLLFGGLLQ